MGQVQWIMAPLVWAGLRLTKGITTSLVFYRPRATRFSASIEKSLSTLVQIVREFPSLRQAK